MSSWKCRSHQGAEGGAQAIQLQLLYDSSEGPAEQHAVPSAIAARTRKCRAGVQAMITLGNGEQGCLCVLKTFEAKRFCCALLEVEASLHIYL